jgi:hypothetical protein
MSTGLSPRARPGNQDGRRGGRGPIEAWKIARRELEGARQGPGEGRSYHERLY